MNNDIVRKPGSRPDTEAAARLQELEHRVAELEKMDRAKDEFLAILSHELRNPIQAILTNAWLINARSRDTEVTRPTDAIERQVGKLSKLLDDLLDVIRVAQPTQLARETVSVQQIVGAAVEAITKGSDSHRRELTVRMPPAPVFVKADPPRLEQAIGNVIRNAVKYSPQQGEITVQVSEGEGEAVIAVRDWGIGIPADELHDIFTLFRQGSEAKRSNEGGLGIGLHITRELVEAHGGTIEARSEGPGKGSEFIIRIPLTADAPVAALPPMEAPTGSEACLSILVVDDNRDSADSMAEVLAAYGHRVQVAYGGQEAVDLATKGGIQVALVDITMPTVNGFQVAQQISASSAGRGTLLVAVTGWGAKSDRELSRQAGFSYHLTKPIDYAVLESLLNAAARKASA